MAIVPTGAIYKSLVFDGEDSRDYGVYITGEAVYNAPERDVEMINIPGRNGSFALDKGRFQNIEVTYPAGIFADNEADFAQGISDFRNFLCSRNGYVRLTDEYNPEEYRMAVYKSGLEVTPAQLKAGEFDITFDCKPQRFLTSGEEPVTIGEWGETETASSDIVSVENPNGVLAVKSLEVDLEPIQSGSGTPSPTNIRPISGHTDVVVSRSGKNLCDTSLVYNGYINSSQQKIASNANARTLYLPCKPNTKYTVSKQAGQRFIVAETTEIPTNNVVVSNIVSDYTASSLTITTSASAKYLVAFVYLSTADTGVTADQMLATCQIELGSTASTYEPYQGDTYTTALGTTVYGGTLDVTTGVLTVTHKLVTLTGASGENWSKSSNSTYDIFLFYDANQLSDKEYYCNRFMATTQTNKDTIGWVWQGSSNHQFRFCYGNHSSMTVDDFKTWVSSNNIQLCTELAQPQTYQLTAQQIELLTGDNNIWSSGGTITLEYGQNPSVLFNPTLFESSPMLEVEGYGTIAFNGYEIELTNDVIGDVLLLGATNDKTSIYYDGSLVNTNDVVTIHDHRNLRFRTNVTTASYTPTSATLTRTTSNIPGTFSYTATLDGRNFVIDLFYSGSDTFSYGTTSSKQDTFTLNIGYTDGNTSGTLTRTFNVTQRATSRYVQTYSTEDTSGGIQIYGSRCSYGEITAYSTQTILGHPTYVECDIGVCYKEVDGEAVSLNQYIDLGSDLPKLASGANTITADNTVTDLKIIPRWWRI